MRTLADDGGIGHATVERALRELKRIGLLRQRRTRDKGGRHGRNVYELNLGHGLTMPHSEAQPCLAVRQHVELRTARASTRE